MLSSRQECVQKWLFVIINKDLLSMPGLTLKEYLQLNGFGE